MANTNEEVVKDSKAGLIAHIIISIACIAVGVSMFFVESSIISTIVYSFSVIAMGILFICFGAYYMIKYFFNKEYVKVSNYGFTMGVILVIIGAVLIFMASDLSVFIDGIVCLVGVILGAIMLQQAFALFHIERGSWFISLILGFATIGASIYLLIEKQSFFKGELLSCIYLITVGSVSLICLLMMAIGLHDHKKLSNRNYSRNMEDAPSTAKRANEDFFDEEPAPVSKPESDVEDINPADDSVFDE